MVTTAARLEAFESVVLTWTHDYDVLGRLHVANEDVLVLASIAMLALDVGLHGASDFRDHDIGHIAGQPLGAMVVKFLHGANRKGLIHASATRDRRQVDPPGSGVCPRTADRLVAFLVPDHHRPVL